MKNTDTKRITWLKHIELISYQWSNWKDLIQSIHFRC